MNELRYVAWTDLFSGGSEKIRREFLVIEKRGQDFLVLPENRKLAAKSLSLYPAQTSRARIAKKILKTALSLKMPLPLQRTTLQLSAEDAFVQFLAGKERRVPEFAILSGNPNAEGRRFLALVFSKAGEPALVVKAGIGEAARKLIRAESAFFTGVAGGFTGLPKFCGALETKEVEALALEYVEGESPAKEDRQVLGKLFDGWLDKSRMMSASEIPAWRALCEVAGESASRILKNRAGEFDGLAFHPTLFHGDFAPWNIKVSRADARWIVLDWERGERVGFPAWDWFHYVVQTGILVEKLTAAASLRRLENLLADSVFQNYAKTAGIAGWEKILAALYLSWCVHVIRPSEGVETAKGLLALLCDGT